MSRSIEIMRFELWPTMFLFQKTICLWIYIILIGLEKLKICVYLFGIGEPIKLLFKQGGGKRET